MHGGDTIIAVASGPGFSARALVRMSGVGTQAALARVSAGGGVAWPVERAGITAARLRVGASGAELAVLIASFPAGHSFTGEPSAEILLPGNPALVERVVTGLLAQPGVREAGPGEFSARAYLNGRLTIDQAEGIAATIAARTEDELAAAGRLMAGATGERYRQWADELAGLLALVEAGIDFTDQEDVVPIPPRELRERLEAVAGEIEDMLGSVSGTEAAGAGAVVVLAGRPNAGKSTLFNTLLGQRRAVVSPAAGTTRDVLIEPLDLSGAVAGGPVVQLVDLAGLDEGLGGAVTPRSTRGEQREPVDREAQIRAREAIQGADVIVQCDPQGRFEPISEAQGKPVIRVRTKADLPRQDPDGAPAGDELAVCALDGFNLGPLRRAIADAAWAARGTPTATALLPRHRRALAQTLRSVHEAAGLLESQKGPKGRGPKGQMRVPAPVELVAGSLREAVDAIGELAGRISPDDVIGRVFATFCVGK